MGHNRTIGGFIQMDTSTGREEYADALSFNLARTALLFYIKAKNYRQVYLPYYFCGDVEKKLIENGVKIARYRLNSELGIDEKTLPQKLNADELLLVVNYFGCLDKSTILKLKKQYKNILVDNVQAFFATPAESVDTLYSCRKWFGVADGAYLFSSGLQDEYDRLPFDHSAKRMKHILLKYEEENGDYYSEYQGIEEGYCSAEICKMSKLTKNILRGIDYEHVKKVRQENAQIIYEKIKDLGDSPFTINGKSIPFMVPIYSEKATKIRKKLIESRCFLPLLWPEVLNIPDDIIEKKLTKNMLLLPCDQRYTYDDMYWLAEQVNSLL